MTGTFSVPSADPAPTANVNAMCRKSSSRGDEVTTDYEEQSYFNAKKLSLTVMGQPPPLRWMETQLTGAL